MQNFENKRLIKITVEVIRNLYKLTSFFFLIFPSFSFLHYIPIFGVCVCVRVFAGRSNGCQQAADRRNPHGRGERRKAPPGPQTDRAQGRRVPEGVWPAPVLFQQRQDFFQVRCGGCRATCCRSGRATGDHGPNSTASIGLPVKSICFKVFRILLPPVCDIFFPCFF